MPTTRAGFAPPFFARPRELFPSRSPILVERTPVPEKACCLLPAEDEVTRYPDAEAERRDAPREEPALRDAEETDLRFEFDAMCFVYLRLCKFH